MKARSLLILAAAAGTLAACSTTGGRLPPTEVIRYHLGEPIARGTVRVEPLSNTGPASIEFKTYAAAVETALLRNGYTLPQGDAQPDYIATVAFTRANRLGPPRPSPFSIGLGGGSFSGGRGGGVGLGGGVSFPIGKSRPQEIIGTELSVQIKRRADQSPIWEGSARNIAPIEAVAKVDAQAQAAKLADALFTKFPGESGRTIEVK
ncbi:hypothetical protein QE385_002484 [Sphingomonas sp. SORGH_AS 950]|uniref:DUF4136 domain-containing protein n=1 Tax=unclassified Sphingomonas TaxID=196159 RepID=UPI002784C489|nr:MULTISPECIES: DUF4136 domain-containing protein [unclassified Sphingomonas]MDQ1158157.1 hypothetical protein [Sphingomonas sp. SORGH_AS_0950]MDR6113958.1 hypothetical protein [Sphingomonas sp. SORGH_AS_0789]MDR6148682.1 hypothetical protein [Sphingomonas sp. SORGH_AS_0742]